MIEALRYVLPVGAGLLEFAPPVLMHFEAHISIAGDTVSAAVSEELRNILVGPNTRCGRS